MKKRVESDPHYDSTSPHLKDTSPQTDAIEFLEQYRVCYYRLKMVFELSGVQIPK